MTASENDRRQCYFYLFVISFRFQLRVDVLEVLCELMRINLDS